MTNKTQWLQLAKDALTVYQMPDAAVEWLAYTHNAVFDVQHDDQRYVLRLMPKSENLRLDWVQSELLWLQAIHAAGLGAPYPAKGVIALADDTVYAVLLHHVAGETLSPAALTPEHMQHIGDYIAQLHDIDYDPPPNFTRPYLDFEGLYGEKGIYHPGDALAIFSDEQAQVMQEAAEQVRTVMDELGTDDAHFGLIHGDLLLKNILFHGDEVRALDFEYCGWGYYLYDLTPLLWQLKTDDRYNTLADAMWDGYSAHHAQADRQQLETLIVGRQVASMRWLAGNLDNPAVKDHAPQLIAQRTAELQHFLKTGQLQRTSITL